MVDFTLTDEQKNLREMAHDFAEKEIRPVAWEYDKDGTWPQDIIEKAWDVGLMNSHIEEAYGGAAEFFGDVHEGGDVERGEEHRQAHDYHDARPDHLPGADVQVHS